MTKKIFFVCLIPALFILLFRMRLAAQDVHPVIRVSETTELRFSHQYHVDEEGLDCIDCHEPAEESTTGSDNLLPDMEVCADCHEVEDDDTCDTCHTDPDYPREVERIEDYSEKFSHERHIGEDLTCDQCHAEVAKKTEVLPFILPIMVACMDCHEGFGVEDDCMACHMPEDRLTPLNHVGDFLHAHSGLARTEAAMVAGKTCMTCHDEDYCQNCHQGENLDRFTHPLNYEFTHALEAQVNDRTCTTCHTDQMFCIDCHRDNLVMPHNHTAGWAVPIDGGRHRLEALNNLETCIACHEENAQTICQPCHGGPN